MNSVTLPIRDCAKEFPKIEPIDPKESSTKSRTRNGKTKKDHAKRVR